MRDKTGKHGLLCTTGGGGNPAVLQPAALPATSGARATCSSLVARSATCRVTSPCRWSTASATSIADSGCSELYKPAKYGGLTEVYVIWGTGPAWHSPSTSGRCVAELRNGCKTVVVDPRFTADASKADVAAHQARHRHGHDARLDALHHREQAVREDAATRRSASSGRTCRSWLTRVTTSAFRRLPRASRRTVSFCARRQCLTA